MSEQVPMTEDEKTAAWVRLLKILDQIDQREKITPSVRAAAGLPPLPPCK